MTKDIEKRFDNSNHELERPFTKRKKQKCYWLSEK